MDKMIKIIFFSYSFFFFSIGCFAADINDITFMTEDYAPHNYEENGKLKGLCSDMIAEMLKRTKSKQDINKIPILPWARSYRQAQKYKNHCLFCTARVPEREKKFKWVGPLSVQINGVVTLKDKNLGIKNKNDLLKFTYSTVRDDIGATLIMEQGVPKEKIYLVKSADISVKQLFLRRVDAWPYDIGVAKYQTAKFGYDSNQLVNAFTLSRNKLYLACQKDTPDEIITTFQKAINDIFAEGLYETYFKKNGL